MAPFLCSVRQCRSATSATSALHVMAFAHIRCLGALRCPVGRGRALSVGERLHGLCARWALSPNTISIMKPIPQVDSFTVFIPSRRVPLVWLFVTLVPWWRWYPASVGYESVSFGLN